MATVNRQNNRVEGRHAPSDAELVTATLAGARSSFDSLVERYRYQVFRFAYVKVRNPQEAEDLAQDTFVAAYKSLGQLREREHFAAWLRRITENVCNMSLRRERPLLIPLTDDLLPGGDTRQSLEQRLVRAEIAQALDGLSETNRVAAILFFVDGFAQKEIAEFLDLPLTTVKRRINLARTQLKREMLDMMKESIGKEKPKPEFGKEVSLKIDVIRWYRRFSEFIDVGQNLVSTLARLAEGDYHETILNETRVIQADIMGGKTMTDSMRDSAPTLGTAMTIGMVRAGEYGGVLEHSARIVVSWLEMEEARARVDAAYWLRTLSFMLRAGVPLIQAVETMKSVPASGSLAGLPDRLTAEIYSGRFAEGFTGCPEFSDSTVALIKAGQDSGLLETAMDLAAAETIRAAYEQAAPESASFPETAPKLLDALRLQTSDPSPENRLGALKALAHIDALPGEQALGSFISALSDPDARVREFAARTLELHPSPSAVPALTAALGDSVAAVREHALLALSAVDQDAAMEQILSRAASSAWDDSPDVRRAAVSILARRREPKAVSLLIRALDDPELLVARPASEALVGMGREVLDPLLESVQSKSPELSDMGWDALYRIDAAVAREVVLRALSVPVLEQSVHASLISKLGVAATLDDAPLLVQAISELQWGHQWSIIRAVGRLKIREAIPGLISWFDHPEPCLWWWVAGALAQIGDQSAAPAIAGKLEEVLLRDPGVETVSVARKLVTTLSALNARQYSGLALRAIVALKIGSEDLAPIANQADAKREFSLAGTIFYRTGEC